jgi:neutral ceramidase
MSQILLAGASVTDITPPLEVGLLTSSVRAEYKPFESIRTPLYARILVLKSAAETVAIVALDLLALSDTSVGGWNAFKEGIAGPVGADKIILCCTHTHNAPESGAITDLYLTGAFKSWLKDIQRKLKLAIGQALNNAVPCSVSIASEVLDGFSLQRRIKTPAGIIMSDSIQPIRGDLMEREPVDRRVKCLKFTSDKGLVVATLIHAICHPVHEMCMPHVSAEFPGELCTALDESGLNGISLFLNGAAGDTNPPTVSLGPESSRRHGLAMAGVVEEQRYTELNVSSFTFQHREIQLAIRPGSGINNPSDALARINILTLGELAIVFLPGEIFVETALEMERNAGTEQVMIVGFSENSVGYVPTETAFEEGGYETGPGRWSYVEYTAERRILNETMRWIGTDLAKPN